MPSPFRILEILACSLAGFLPYFLLLAYPFRNHMRFRGAFPAVLTAIAAAAHLALDVMAAYGLVNNPALIILVSVGSYVLFCLLTIRGPFSKMCLSLVTVTALSLLIRFGTKLVHGALFPRHSAYSWSYLVVLLALQALILIPYSILLYRKLAYFFTGTTPLPPQPEVPAKNKQPRFLAAEDGQPPEAARQKPKKESVQKQQTLQYNSLMARIHESERLRRQLRQQVDLLSARLADKDYEGLEKQLTALRSRTDAVHINGCADPDLAPIVDYFAALAAEGGWDLTVSIPAIAESSIPKRDISVLLGNLLDNAADACRNYTEQQARISVTMAEDPESLRLTVENTFRGEIRKDSKDRYLSAKYDGRGIGLEVSRQIAKRHLGSLECSNNDGIFQAKILLIKQ